MKQLDIKKFTGIMIFYILITNIIGPIIGYYTSKDKVLGLGLGFLIGSVISIILWTFYGSKML